MDEQRLLENLGQLEYVMEAPDTTGEEDINWIKMETEGYQGEQEIFFYANSVELGDLSKLYNQHKAAEMCAQLSCAAQPRAEGTL